jgi:hypothetical protein
LPKIFLALGYPQAVRLVFRRQAQHGAPKPAVIHILKGLFFVFKIKQRAGAAWCDQPAAVKGKKA